MSSNEYHFITRWRVKGTTDEIFDVISRPLDYPRWWPSVYLRTEEIEPGDEHGIGRRIRLHTKGWLPYTLLWESTSTESVKPQRIAIRADGDFLGRGIWTFEQDGECVNSTFDWKLTAEKPLLRWFSIFLKPIFSANHRWAMQRGLESLKLELERRHARNAEQLRAIPAPPGPNRTSWIWLFLGTALIVIVIVAVLKLIL
jgi:hypothetical protein